MKTCLSLLLVLLVSCSGAPAIESTNQCSTVFKYVTDLEGKEYIDVAASYCICRKYAFREDYVGPEGGSWKEPIKSCDRLVGWKSDNGEYGRLAEFWVRVREYLEEVRRENGH